jgi:hypothetical protein
MFSQANGRPIDPRRDMQDWKDLLAEAGVRGLGCTTPATQQRPRFYCWACRSVPRWTA